MYKGITGKLKIGVATAVEIAYISNWSVEDTVEIIEFVQLGKKTKEKMAGMSGWTASADGAIEFANEGSHKALFDAMHKGDKVVCEFYLDPTTKFTGTGLIESLSINLAAEDKGNVSISITGIGELVYPGATTTPQQP